VKSPPPVKKSSIAEVSALAARFAGAGHAAGFRLETFGAAEGCPLFALTKRTTGIHPRIYLSSGMHGDEPAPPLALLRLLERGFFGGQATWFLCPLLNPAGLARGTRGNADDVDLNRDYRHLAAAEVRAHRGWLQRQPPFSVTLSLHEDWEANGFYLYELNPENRPSLAQPIIDAVTAGCPIDQSAEIDGREARGGIIRPIADPLLRELWPESIYLRVHHTTLTYTIETPSGLPLEQRIAAHCTAVETAVARL